MSDEMTILAYKPGNIYGSLFSWDFRKFYEDMILHSKCPTLIFNSEGRPRCIVLEQFHKSVIFSKNLFYNKKFLKCSPRVVDLVAEIPVEVSCLSLGIIPTVEIMKTIIEENQLGDDVLVNFTTAFNKDRPYQSDSRVFNTLIDSFLTVTE